ncbi:hypothetical protein FQN54_005263 [Arachnomyces sp. PD_36]|nr:hypothetical protein FQN54_005263 [Arachnomyces sp. PD_36]
MLIFTTLLALLPLAAHARFTDPGPHCMVMNGRIIPDAEPSDFNDFDKKIPYDPDFNLGEGLEWGDVLLMPDVERSLFDRNASEYGVTKSVEVTIEFVPIGDRSIFQGETAVRRAELIPYPHDKKRIVASSMKLRFSLQFDPQRALNYSHEYSLVSMQSKDYTKIQWSLSTGTAQNPDVAAEDPQSLQIRGSTAADVPQELFFETPFTEGWHNFEMDLHFVNNSMQVSYSTGWDLPKPIGPLIENDLSGLGFYQIGLQKKPTDAVPGDSTKTGYQESGIEEGMIYGGIFIMDNTDRGCVIKQRYDACCYNVGELDGKPVEGLY